MLPPPARPDAPPVMLVTGAARRVGAAIARALHASGAHVVLHYRSSATQAQALANALNALRTDSASLAAGDIAEDGEPERIIEHLIERHGRLDALVNNASTFYPTPMGSIDLAAWHDLIGSNLKGPLFLSQAAAPHLRRQLGSIVNIIDIHAERPLKHYATYCTAKAGLLGLTRALAVELSPDVRVNGIAPGPIEWPEDQQFSPDERQAIIAHTLLKREGRPEDIARTAHFLVCEAPYITGQVIAVDGGRNAHL
ncbi:MAG: pteridine reductase [Rhodocyclaceae bacterium]